MVSRYIFFSRPTLYKKARPTYWTYCHIYANGIGHGADWGGWKKKHRLRCLTFGGKHSSSVSIDAAFLNRSLMSQHLLHDIPLFVIIALCQSGGEGGAIVLNIANYTFQRINLLFVYRYIKYRYIFSLR